MPLLLAFAFAAALNGVVEGFFIDDAYISFHYAENLADHGTLYYNPGQTGPPGYTNPLYVFSLAALHRAFGGFLSYELLARALGSLALAAILFPLLAAVAEHPGQRRRGGSFALGALVLGLFGLFPHLLPNFYCGLETGPFTLCLFAMLAASASWGPGSETRFLAALAAALSLRLDGIVVVLPLLAAYAAVAIRRSEPRRIARLGYAFLAAGLVYLLHLAIAGTAVPLSFHQKRADFSLQTFWSYATFCLLATAPLLVIACRRRAGLAALVVLGSLHVSLFYSFFTHWMFQRYAFPFAFASFAVLLLAVLRTETGRERAGRELALVALYALAAFPPAALAGYSWVSGYRVAMLNAKRIAAAMNAADLPPARRTVAAEDAGYVAYATGWRLLDLLGLTTPEVLAGGAGPALERLRPTVVLLNTPNRTRPGAPDGPPVPPGYRLVKHLPLTNRYWWPEVDYGYSVFVDGGAEATLVRRLEDISVDVEREMGWQRYPWKLLARLASLGS